jgi:hypothetical protein
MISRIFGFPDAAHTAELLPQSIIIAATAIRNTFAGLSMGMPPDVDYMYSNID